VAQYGIRVVPVSFYSEGKVYKDWVDITPAEAYALLQKDPQSFKTSAISPADCLNAYREAGQPAKAILCVTVSSKLSAVYNVALAAAREAAARKGLAEVLKIAEATRDRVGLVALMDTVRYVYRTGRIPRVAAWAGSMLNIRPVFTIASGVPRFLGAVRNKERGVDRLIKIMRSKVGQNPVHVAVMHAYAPDEAEKLKERVAAEFDCAELWLTEFSPVMGYACGTGTLGLAFYSDD